MEIIGVLILSVISYIYTQQQQQQQQQNEDKWDF